MDGFAKLKENLLEKIPRRGEYVIAAHCDADGICAVVNTIAYLEKTGNDPESIHLFSVNNSPKNLEPEQLN